jgi:hypothetical protein
MLGPHRDEGGDGQGRGEEAGQDEILGRVVDSVTRASICSVTFIGRDLGAMEEVTRAAIIRPTRTGPSSRTMPIATIWGTTASAPKRLPPA